MRHSYTAFVTAIILCSFLISFQMNAQDVERRVEVIRLSDHPWLGVQISDVSDIETPSRENGAYINEVIAESPADSAGLREGDVIIRFGNLGIPGADDLRRAVRESEKDQPVVIVVVRDGREQQVSVTLRDRPHRQALRMPGPFERQRIVVTQRYGRLGVNVIELSSQLREYFMVPQDSGVLVEKVHADTPAEKAGIRAGDVIITVGDRNIDTARRLRRVLSTYDAGEQIQVEFIREGTKRTVTAELDERNTAEFYIPDINREDLEIRIFGPGGAEEFRRNLEESIRPGLEDLRIQLKEHFDEFQIKIPERIHEISRQITI